MSRSDTENYHRIFSSDVPLLDVRAPVEFAHGSFPGAINRPLLDDEQRERIGTTYKQEGESAAIELGQALATPEVQDQRVASWLDFVGQNEEGYLFCQRGGMRSEISQSWLSDRGIQYPRVTGGYKAMRRFLLNSIDTSCMALACWVLSGRTGTGKTHLLPTLPRHIDLEQIAGHRGSSFGKRLGGQPTQVDFEHDLAIQLLKANHENWRGFVVEDESRLIGRRSIPERLFTTMKGAPIIILEAPHEERVRQIVDDYVVSASKEYRSKLGEERGWQEFEAALHDSLDNIRRRLGEVRHGFISSCLVEAMTAFRNHEDRAGFEEVVGLLLDEYYDPMYDYQLSKKSERVRFRGDKEAIGQWIEAHWPN